MVGLACIEGSVRQRLVDDDLRVRDWDVHLVGHPVDFPVEGSLCRIEIDLFALSKEQESDVAVGHRLNAFVVRPFHDVGNLVLDTGGDTA